MEVNLFDFDKTIYDGDSSIDFFRYSIKCNKMVLFYIPKIAIYYLLYFFKIKSKKQLKECFFSYLKHIDNINLMVNDFWKKNEKKIKKFYNDRLHDKDIIISASPEFLLKPICEKLNVKDIIATKVDKHNGKFISENCKGEEKVIMFKKKYPLSIVNEVYTDSLSDKPIVNLGKKGFLVKGEKIVPFKD